MRLAYGVVLVTVLGCGDDGGTNPGGDGGNGVDSRPGIDGAIPMGCDPQPNTPNLGLQMVGSGYSFPVFVTSPPGDSRLFVVEQNGTIEIIGGGTFLNISNLVDGVDFDGDESGLLGMAFDPMYSANGRFFVYYVQNGGGNLVISSFTVSGDPDVANAGSEQPLLTIPHGGGHHYGGSLNFGPGDYLFAGTGDGGFGGCDPDERAQDLGMLLGKLLRLDPDGGTPAGNPFGDEIWASGLRNPWRFSFDRATEDLYLGDVGQGTWEEVNVMPSSAAGLNYGWDTFEADLCHAGANTCDGDDPGGSCSTSDRTFPVKKYNDGAAVIGGYVYRGSAMPALSGTYFYGDYGQGFVRSFRWCGGGSINDERTWAGLEVGNLSSFGEDSAGELYIVEHDTGRIDKIVAQ